MKTNYLSDLFKNEIWPLFSKTLNTKKSKSDYYSLLCDISSYAKKDFLLLSDTDAQSYFNHLLMRVSNGKQSEKTVRVKLARLRSVSNFTLRHSYLFELQQSYVHNPFQNVNLPTAEEYLTKKNVPSIEEMDDILSLAKKNYELYVILSLIIRCGLSAGEICSIKYTDFVQDAAGNVGISYQYRNLTRYVKVPADVLTILQDYIGDTDVADSEYLFCNRRKNQLRVRDLERLYLKFVPTDVQPHYTLSDLRNGSAAYMLLCGASAKEVSEYINISIEWMRRFDKVLPELQRAACDYTNILIKSPKESS